MEGYISRIVRKEFWMIDSLQYSLREKRKGLTKIDAKDWEVYQILIIVGRQEYCKRKLKSKWREKRARLNKT